MPKKSTEKAKPKAIDRLAAFYKQDKEVINLPHLELGRLLGCSLSNARDVRRQFCNLHKLQYRDNREGGADVALTVEEIDKIHEIKESAKKESRKDKDRLQRQFEEIERLKRELGVALDLQATPQSFKINPPKRHASFSTAVALASDWHYEEEVKSSNVSGLNSFNLAVADKRINLFFTNVTELSHIMMKDTHIETLILALLGDFISGDIHGDIIESCRLRPMEASMAVMNRLIVGIDYLIANTDFKLLIPCHSGNHGRTTKEQYHANEAGHSIEWLMYNFLRRYYESNKRITFMIADGYHTYIDINGYVMRNHHGHAIRYQGGIGGLSIPAYKAIANWNKGRVAHMDCFGHSHTSLEGGNFVSNGSLIGYSSYSVAVKAGYEKPTQTMFMINDKHKELTMKCKIFLEE